MNIVVTGGRNYRDTHHIFKTLDELHKIHPITHLLHGDANGVDRLCGAWAISRKIPCQAMPAQWDLHGKSAGYKRNIKMADTKPDMLVAFPGGTGTAHMVDTCTKRRIQIWKA